MKILHVIPAIASCYGGPSQAVYDMCQALQQVDCEVQIATTDADGAGHLPVQHGQALAYQNVSTIFFPRQYSEAFKVSQPLARWLSQHVREFDLVHIHAVFSHACLAAARACRKAQIPYIVRTIGNLDPWSLKQKKLRKRLFWHLVVKRMLEDAAAIHYTTRDEQRLAESALGLERGVVIPLGVEEKLLAMHTGTNPFLIRFPLLQQSPYLLTLCRLHPKKNLEALLTAFLRLTSLPEFQAWKLVIAGEGEMDYVAYLHHLVQQQGGTARVLFVGWLRGEEKFGALRGAELFALPSHQENFGLSIVEAMACGVPVLISEQVNLAADVADAGAGWIVKLEAAALQESLQDALRQEAARRERGKAAHELVRRQFTWPAVATKLMDLYSGLSTQSPLRFASAS